MENIVVDSLDNVESLAAIDTTAPFEYTTILPVVQYNITDQENVAYSKDMPIEGKENTQELCSSLPSEAVDNHLNLNNDSSNFRILTQSNAAIQ